MNQNNPAALELHNLVKKFGSTRAIDDISLEVQRGEIICLAGSSGCGKSTLLRLIAGVDHPDSGSILLDGREVVSASTFVEPEERRIGFVFQDYALFPHLSVERNIMFGLGKIPRQEARERVAELLAHVGLQAHARRYPHTLSGGEQQRVALARALAPRPSILLMDEPFSNLDRGLRDSVRHDTLALLRKLGTTVIMVTHDPEEALSAGDRVVLMRAGRIVQTGTGYDLHDRPASRYVADFFCTFNKIQGTIRDGSIRTPLGSFACPETGQDGAAAEAFIRPGAIGLLTSAPASGHAIAGTICERMLTGETEQLSIRVEGLDDLLRIRSMIRTPPETTSVWLTIQSAGVLVFPATT